MYTDINTQYGGRLYANSINSDGHSPNVTLTAGRAVLEQNPGTTFNRPLLRSALSPQSLDPTGRLQTSLVVWQCV